MNKFTRTALRTGVPFGIAMGLFNGVQRGASAGAASGIACGVAFGLAMAGFAHWQAKKFAAMRGDFEPDGLVKDGAANLGGRGGWLFLTKNRLVFVPHKVNVSSERVEISRADIVAIEHARSRPRQIVKVKTSTAAHQFLVDPSDGWGDALPNTQRA